MLGFDVRMLIHTVGIHTYTEQWGSEIKWPSTIIRLTAHRLCVWSDV